MQGLGDTQVPPLGTEPDRRRQFIACSTHGCEARVDHGSTRMTIFSFLALLPALFGFATAQSAGEGARLRTVVIQDEIVMRVPVRPYPQAGISEWVERKGPKCIASEDIRGAMLSGPEHVDFVLFNRQRIRAQLADNCAALDFYSGFYLNSDDEKVCARRDNIRSRMGSSCSIDRFRTLVRKGPR